MAKSTSSAISEVLGNMLRAQPFAPFDIKTTDGDTIHVWNPDYVIRSPSGATAIAYEKDDHFRIINLRQVVTLEPTRPKKGMLGQGGGKRVMVQSLLTEVRSFPELLSPAGDWEAMRAAVANGANAVYFGLDQFNARHRATNFTLEELPQIVDYLHDRNVKGFLTFNTLIFSDELTSAVDYIKVIAASGVDAVIVQDLGLARLIQLMCPTLHVHGSTQMTLTEPRGIEFVRKLGVKRVVLARELSLDDIKKIIAGTDMPLEVFVHGALCVAYSGQCLTSEALGGRSANRGQCAQACRLPYDLIVDGVFKDLGEKAYLLSPQDLAAYDLVADLTQLGVVSFKIEGRLKSAHYVAATSQTYRQAIDAAKTSTTFQISETQRAGLEQTFSRGFTHGFLSGVDHQKLVAARFPKSRGRRIGTVLAVKLKTIVVGIDGFNPTPVHARAQAGTPRPGNRNAPSHASRFPLDRRPNVPVPSNKAPLALKPGDGVVFDEGHPEQDEQGGRVFFVSELSPGRLEIEFGQGDVNLAAVSVGAIVWKTDDPALRKHLEHTYARDVVVDRRPIDANVSAHVGAKLTVTLTEGARSASASWDKPLEPAQKFPVSEQVVREQLSRLGDTPFELRHLTLNVVGGPMVPKSVLNDLRRQATEQLLVGRDTSRVHEVVQPDALEHLRTRALRPPLPEGEGWGEGLHKAQFTTLQSDTTQSAQADPTGVPNALTLALSLEAQGSDVARTGRLQLHLLVRTIDQLDAALAYQGDLKPSWIYCDFEDVRRYPLAVQKYNAANVKVGVATMRVVKPGEDGWLKQILDSRPDAVLVRNLASIAYFQELAPELPLIGDYALNISNELTAQLFAESGLVRFVPSYDLNWRQMSAMLSRFPAGLFECVVHQHMPMFHMEHCVFAHTLSTGKDYRDCGRPCEKHQVDLKDRKGEPHPLIPDAGCRNTVFNAAAQSAAEFIPEMLKLGIRHFRVELLREKPEEVGPMIARYAGVMTGATQPQSVVRSLRVLNQLGVTRGTLDRE